MPIVTARACVCGVLAGWMVAATAAAAQEVLTPQNAIDGQYIVVLKDDEVKRTSQPLPVLVEQLAREHGGTVFFLYEHALRGFAVALPASRVSELAKEPLVRYVEQDSVIVAIQTQGLAASWGLDRIDQRNLPLSQTYTYYATGANVHAYIIDTGIRRTHVEFSSRVLNGFTSVNDGNGTNDCNGHGTHVAGTVGGETYGVAKDVFLHPVRVLNCQGSGTVSGVIAGVDWVTQRQVQPAVANMSLGGAVSSALDDAVRNSIAAGVTYAIAAGNSSVDACQASPARVTQALTAGSSGGNTSIDARSSFSNFGSCVDLFAPGEHITSAWSNGDTGINTISGTSMASPHVAGVAALFLEGNPSATPEIVHQAVVSSASVDKLTNIGAGSPNRLLHSLFDAPPPDGPPNAAFTFDCGGLTCTFDGTGSLDDNGITAYTWSFGDGQTGSGATVSHTFASSGTFTVTLTVTDTASQSESASRSVTVTDGAGGPPCTSCTSYTNTLSPGGVEYPYIGSYYRSLSGTHRGWLRGPANANFDMRLQKRMGFFWVTVAQSVGPTAEEQITYSGTPGTYRWRINGVSGSGSYTFWVQHPW
jgi:serine protease